MEYLQYPALTRVLDEPSIYHTPGQQHLWMPPHQMHPCQIQQQHQQQSLQQLPQKNPFCTTQLPDSPPDSGSEPYSPPNSERQNEMQQQNYNGKSVNAPPPGYPLPHPSPHPVLQPNSAYRNYYPEPPKLNHHQEALQLNPQHLLGSNQGKKRRLLDSPQGPLLHPMVPGMIKSEPVPGMSDYDDDPLCTFEYCDTPNMNSSFLEGAYQVIKWQPYQPKGWAMLLDQHYKELPTPTYRVDADKGFNFSGSDDAFVCQKKNHFQVTVHIEIHGQPKYMKNPETGSVQPLDAFYLHFNGIKMESPSQTIKIEQSQSDRSKKAFYPVRVDLPYDQTTKVTVGRLHFSETTTNNMRKKGKPNPDQRYFMLVVALHGHSSNDSQPIGAQVSEKIIVRASNPGQFDQDVDVTWQKGSNGDSIFHAGRVGINTDRPDEALTVHGNLKLTGHLLNPSDRRIKQDFHELDSQKQLQNISKVKVYNYKLDHQVADHLGVPTDQRRDTGVIAQEISTVLPDAVKETGDFNLPNGRKIEGLQVVNKDRLYMESVGAVKELCKVTDKLENRIGELETMNAKLARYKSCSSLSSCSIASKEKAEKDKENNEKKKMASVQRPHRHHHHHHHGHQCSRHGVQPASSDDGPFSNRFIQVTIFVLLLVMAFCLIAITTLYAIKRHESGPSSLSEALGTTPVPGTWQGLKPFTPSYCASNHCKVVCCGRQGGTHTSTNPPQNDPNHNPTVTTGPIIVINPGDHLGGGGSDPDKIHYQKYSTTMDPNSIYSVNRIRRSAPSVTRGQIVVTLDNQTLDDYCETCHNSSNYFKYRVPLSQVFPLLPLTFQFQLAEDWSVIMCSESTVESCSSEPQLASTASPPVEWTLPVGRYQHSQYRFIAGVQPQRSMCNHTASELGDSVWTYDLKFERVIPQSCASNNQPTNQAQNTRDTPT